MRRKDNMPNRPRIARRQGAGSVVLSVVAVVWFIGGVLSLWSDMPVVGLAMVLISAAVLVSQYNYYWRNERGEFDN
jgi:hypothetical protein